MTTAVPIRTARNWAKTASDRSYTVEPLEDGTGYLVTRYDQNGTFKTIAGAEHPGCTDEGAFSGVDDGHPDGRGPARSRQSARLRLQPRRETGGFGELSDFLVAAFGSARTPTPPRLVRVRLLQRVRNHWRDLRFMARRSRARARSGTANPTLNDLGGARESHGSEPVSSDNIVNDSTPAPRHEGRRRRRLGRFGVM